MPPAIPQAAFLVLYNSYITSSIKLTHNSAIKTIKDIEDSASFYSIIYSFGYKST